MANFLTTAAISKTLVEVGKSKASLSICKMLVLGILAGMFIGYGAHLATTIATGHYEYLGFKKLMMGAVFSTGLMLVIILGAELFTGNNLMTIALFQKRITPGQMLRSWFFVYVGNLIGSILLALIIAKFSGLLSGAVGGTAIKIAAEKTSSAEIAHLNHNFAFFFRAIGCNMLVCLAFMMAVAAQNIAGKILAIFFPIMAFVSSGFEHCIANMYFIPAGIFAKSFPGAVEASGKSTEALAALNWGSMISQNLITVTLGNIVGGAILIGVVYWYLYVNNEEV